jgi:acetyl esterase/lipase
MGRLARICLIPAALVAALALPAAAPAEVTEEGGLTYGSAVDFDGERQRLDLDLYRPEARRRPRPAIIWVHGGGFYFGERAYMSAYARKFAERGYVSATITYRLADDGELDQVGYPRAIEAAQHDAQAAVRWLRRHAKRLGVDRTRIYIGGHSAGAITALEVGVSAEDSGDSGNPGFSSRVDGAIAIAGLMANRGQIGRRDAPMLLFHGTADDTVPFSSSVAVRQSARDAGVRCRLVTFPGADHYVAYSALDAIVGRSAAWLRRRW